MIKILAATLSGTIIYLMVGYLVFEFILGNYMNANTTQLAGFKKSETESSFVMLLVSCAAYALLLSVIMGNYTNISTFQEGAILGAIIGILVAIMTNSYWYSTSHFFNSLAPLLADVAL